MKNFLSVMRALAGALFLYGALLLSSSAIFHFPFAPKEAAGEPAFFPVLLSVLVMLPILYSAARLSIIYATLPRRATEPSKRDLIRERLRTPETLAVCLLFLLLPYPIPAISAFFPDILPSVAYLVSRALLPFFFLAFVLGLRAGFFYREKHPDKNCSRRNFALYFLLNTVKSVFFYILVGIICGFLYSAVVFLPKLVLAILFPRWLG